MFQQKGFKDDSVETVGEQKHNLNTVVTALIEYYNDKLDIDLKSQIVINSLKEADSQEQNMSMSVTEKLLCTNVDKLLQTGDKFQQGSCEAMMQLCIFIFALVLNNENLKDDYIESIMELDEEVQEALTNIIQDSMNLLDTLQSAGKNDSS